MGKKDEQKSTGIEAFLEEVKAIYGEGSVMVLGQDNHIKVDVIPTSVELIDTAIGAGGIPRGRITEIFGKEGTGKTTVCLHAIATANKQGMKAGFIDAEHALDTKRMQAIGVDFDKVVISQPNSGEEALEICEMMVRSGEFGIIVVDSVAALTPQAEIDKDMGDSVMGVHARLMSQAMRKLVAPVAKHNVALMFTNQTRAKLGSFIPGEATCVHPSTLVELVID